MKFGRIIFFFVFILPFIFCVPRKSIFPEEDYKKLAGPPEEFPYFVIPQDSQTALISNAAFVSINLDTKKTWNGELIVDSDSLFSFCAFSKESTNFNVKIALPGETDFLPLKEILDILGGSIQDSPVGIGSTFITTWCYTFPEPPVGIWKMIVTVPDSKPNNPIGYWILYNQSPIKLKTYNTEDRIAGKPLRLVASILNASNPSSPFIFNNSASCEAKVATPNGTTETVKMNDNGIDGDLLANDGIFTGILYLNNTGEYESETIFRGKTLDNRDFLRSTVHYWEVVSSTIKLGNVATAKIIDNQMAISIQITGDQPDDNTNLVFAQVWGTSQDKKTEIPVAWISGMADRKSDGVSISLTLFLDLQWIYRANVYPPFSLKQIRVQDRSIQTQLSTKSVIPIKLLQKLPLFVQQNVTTITQEMRRGKLPAKYRNLNLTEANRKLLIVHGYCADDPPFSSEDFTDYIFFNDPLANRNLQLFAEMIVSLARDNKVDVFSIVAHSQGGLASLHLLSYYFSGLDLSTGGRRIQSVGSPYQGTVLAGGLATIGYYFGQGCGSNDALTKSGAREWLAGIPFDIQKEVYFLTTEGISACSYMANLFGLDVPNDGVTSKDFGILPGGNNQGHLIGWCHSVDFSSPSQCQNHENNKKMNKLAAR